MGKACGVETCCNNRRHPNYPVGLIAQWLGSVFHDWRSGDTKLASAKVGLPDKYRQTLPRASVE